MTESIVGAMVNFVGEKLLQCIAEPIKRRYNYLRRYKSNIEKLRGEERNLKDARNELQMRVTIAENNAEVIVPAVETWFDDVNKILEKKTGIESEITHIQSGCFAVKSRLSLSEEAENITEDMKKLQDCYRNFDRIANPAPPMATASVRLGPTNNFQSRKDIEEDIKKALREFKKVGICGMGGVGKTTMAKRIMKRVKKEGLFDEIVMVVVSQNIDKSKIQDAMAEKLGLTLEEKDLQCRAHKLHARLMGEKRILIVIDDVWEYLELEELGIPCEIGLQECKILLTSRHRDVFNQMDVQKVCEIQTLPEEEAWPFFEEKVGTFVDEPDLLSIAQRVAMQCKGLPVALVNVAMALKGIKDKIIWEDALQQLESSNPEDMPHVLDDVYKPLKLSYDFLKSPHAKSIFLLCCLFPEDYNIPIEGLSVYAMGLRMFETIGSLEQVRKRTYSLVNMLKSRCLLLEGYSEHHVKMHDVVRDVSIFIASKARHIRCDDCTWISSFLGETIDLSTRSSFPNLRLLLIHKSTNEELQTVDKFFEGKNELNVLCMVYDSLTSLPRTIDSLKNLRTLLLDSCKYLESISIVGELVNLEILICRWCSLIKELPVEIGRLNCLRLLEFSYCRDLKTIAPGIISRLVGLEELKLINSFENWEAENNMGKQRKNAGLRELESLSNLTCLEIQFKDSALAAEQISLSQKILKFDVTIGCLSFKSRKGSENRMVLRLPREIALGNWILKFLKDSNCMGLEGEGCNLQLEQALQNKRSLTLRKCPTMKKLTNIKTSSIEDARSGNTIAAATIFPHLESLELVNFSNLEEICHIDDPIPNKESRFDNVFKLPELKILKLQDLPKLTTFCKRIESIEFPLLTEIEIGDCPQLKSLAFIIPAIPFPHLESLKLVNLINLEEICHMDDPIPNEGSEFDNVFEFSKLKILKLWDLPNLTEFCKGIESTKFPLLTEMDIKNCRWMKSISSTSSSGCGNNQKNSGGINPDHDNDISLHLFCEPEKVAFGSLKTVKIHGYESNGSTTLFRCRQITAEFFTKVLEELQIINCGNIRSLFSSSVARALVLLRKLAIRDCSEMVKVIEDNEEEKYSHVCGHEITSLFPMLQHLDLRKLPQLKIFCESRCDLELPSLKDVRIENCPKMERFIWGSLATPRLEAIRFKVKEEESFYKWEAKLEGIKDEHSDDNDELSFWTISMLLGNSRSEQKSFKSNTGKHDSTIVCPSDFGFSLIGFEKLMHLRLPKEVTLKNWIHQCVSWSVDYMQLEGEGLNNLDLRQARNMRLLILKDCSWVKKFENITASLIDDGSCGTSTTTTGFPRLEYLQLEKLANLEEICDLAGPISTNFFKNLKELCLVHLPTLKHLLANDWLLQLESLRIEECEMLEQIFLWNGEEENKRDIGHESRHVIFPKLKSLTLENLANLVTFYKRIENIAFPLLTKMIIWNCPNLKYFVSTDTSSGCRNSQNNLGGIIHDDVDDDDSLHWFCKQDKVKFGGLNELRIRGYKNTSILGCPQIPIDFFTRLEDLCIADCGGINSLFSSSAAQNLVNLRWLRIVGCEKMVKVIEDDNKEKDACSGGQTINCLFPKLEHLGLDNLSKLKSFCEWRCALELLSLNHLSFYNCPEMERFSLGSLNTPNLKEIYGGGIYTIIKTDEDLNGALQRLLFKVKKKEE